MQDADRLREAIARCRRRIGPRDRWSAVTEVGTLELEDIIAAAEKTLPPRVRYHVSSNSVPSGMYLDSLEEAVGAVKYFVLNGKVATMRQVTG
jgi:hypothetical protein